MHLNRPTTDKTEDSKGTHALSRQWETIDWEQVEKDVNRLQTRIGVLS
ncbi:hypothetical protein [Eubacterium barkeri]|uniref:Reverse transcriptase N-terminal domain-containing protein n=1 Tax=Eubacterium barkeri TaxID=1528 RepID=A0A1H3K686_EUBBA|nr:hypothetical protein [Eubacterium barkeri]SDY47235.1 hypothetical protein SAMN04488579_13911 [Eubacterium barkeri]